ncbi:hypothetical protein ISS30_08880 [bacterium]|nr:hypothetical protein [bacterium]
MKIISRAAARAAPTYRIFEWCHASPHDTKTLFLSCMVSTAESRHHIELNPEPYFQNEKIKAPGCRN